MGEPNKSRTKASLRMSFADRKKMKEEFNLSNWIYQFKEEKPEGGNTFILTPKVQEFIKRIEKIYADAQMYSDMDDDTFWATSTISPQEAQKRADYYGEFLKEVRKLAGEKLILKDDTGSAL